MSTWVFEDWADRVYDDPAVGRVSPGDTLETDTPPDHQYWTLVEASLVDLEAAGNRGLEALKTVAQVFASVSENTDIEAVSENVDTLEQSKGDN